MTVNYYIDGYNIATIGAYVSQSDGLIDSTSLKSRLTGDWPGEHGEVVDHASYARQKRVITMECFIRAATWESMVSGFATLMSKFRTGAMQQLLIEVNDITAPYVAMVYLSDHTPLKKRLKAGEMIGVFTLKLIEPEPVKMLIRPTGVEVGIVFASTHPVKVYWGDGAVSTYLADAPITAIHTYAAAPATRLFALVTGRVEGFVGLSLTNATQVWSML